MNNTIVFEGGGPARRIAAIDVARGIAILGTLWTNIWVFSDPDGLVGAILGAPQSSGQLVILALSQGKFLALLSVLFGTGVAIQQSATLRRGRRWPGRYLVRAALLLLDGVVNYILIAEFDVLMGYAVTGAIVAWLLLRSDRAQRATILVCAGLHLLLIGAIALAVQTSGGGGGGQELQTPYASASFLELARFRLENIGVFRAETMLIALSSIALFLLGARLYRAGVFAPAGGRLRRRLLLAGAIVLPVDLWLGVFGGPAGMLLQRYLTAPAVALGLLALIASVCLRRGASGWFARRMAELGRTALSCYLLQNLLAGAIFYGWGLGLAARVEPWRSWTTPAAWLLIAAAALLFARLWLDRFRLGPMEWLQHRAVEALVR